MLTRTALGRTNCLLINIDTMKFPSIDLHISGRVGKKVMFKFNGMLKRKRKTVFYFFITTVLFFKCIAYLYTNLNKVPERSVTQKAKIKSEESHDVNLVLINAYMRSGSTFLGILLGYKRDSFYIYEPLRKLFKYRFIKGHELCYSTKHYCIDSPGSLNTSLKVTEDLFHCKLKQYEDQFTELLYSKSGPKWKAYVECMNDVRFPNEDCLNNLEKTCREQNNRVQKVLRLSLDDTASLITRNRNLKVIHIFRDPRAILNSEIFTFWYPVNITTTGKIEENAKALCARMENDLLAGYRLVKKYPRKLRLVQYEDMIQNYKKAKLIYDFIGMKVSEEDTNFLTRIYHNFNGKLNNDSNFNIYAFKYRKSLPFSLINMMQTHCSKVLQMLGLKVFQTEAELHDPTFNPIAGSLPFRL